MQDDGADAGAAHGHEARLQAEVVTVPRPFLRADLAQQQHLAHDGFGLQAQVLLALRVQTALEQAAGLCQGREESGVAGDAAQRAGGQKPVSQGVPLPWIHTQILTLLAKRTFWLLLTTSKEHLVG